MKALSLWQPWATLIAIGAKQYETRSWATSYRGELVIHAAKRPNEAKALADAIYMKTASGGRIRETASEYERFAIAALYADAGKQPGDFIPALPLGAGLCIVRLIGCYRTESMKYMLSPQEIAFGDYSPGRFAWKLEMIQRFSKPEPMRGAQGLFDWKWPDLHDGMDDPRYPY